MWVLVLNICRGYELILIMTKRQLPEELKYGSNNDQNRSYGEMESFIIETYNNDVMLHGSHIHKTETYMVIATMYYFTPNRNDMPRWKYVLWYIDNYLCFLIPV